MTRASRRGDVARWLVGILLIGHALIHLMGPVDIWGVADLEQLSGEPSIAVAAIPTEVLAIVWLLPLALLMAAGVAVLTRRAWWRPIALIGAASSQLAIMFWWDDASAGTIANLLVLAAVVLAPQLHLAAGPGADRPGTRQEIEP
jgi:hypothetical protein